MCYKNPSAADYRLVDGTVIPTENVCERSIHDVREPYEFVRSLILLIRVMTYAYFLFKSIEISLTLDKKNYPKILEKSMHSNFR